MREGGEEEKRREGGEEEKRREGGMKQWKVRRMTGRMEEKEGGEEEVNK